MVRFQFIRRIRLITRCCCFLVSCFSSYLVPTRSASFLLSPICSYSTMLFICSTSFSRYVYTVYTFSILVSHVCPLNSTSHISGIQYTFTPPISSTFNNQPSTPCITSYPPSTRHVMHNDDTALHIFNLNTILRPGIGVITTRPARSFRRRTTDPVLLGRYIQGSPCTIPRSSKDHS